MAITTAQIRGARGILNWSQSDLAERTGISATSIGSIENGQSTPRANTLTTIQSAFERNGIEFLGLNGMRMRSDYVRTLSGPVGFSEFLDDVYQMALSNGTSEKPLEIFLSNVVHENWTNMMGPEKWKNHTDRMTAIKNVMDIRILVKEGDWNFPASAYSQYKWVPQDMFNDKAFYSYHDRLAFLNFKNNDVEIIIIRQTDFAEGYRNLFRGTWDKLATSPEKSAAKKSGKA